MSQQNPKIQRVTLTVQARILDWHSVAQEALDLGAPASATPAAQVALVVMEMPSALSCLSTVTPAHASVHLGAEGDCWSVSATFDVSDVDALVAAAKQQTSEVWLDEELADSIQTVEAALYELCCASNSRISPADLGFEYLDNQSCIQAPA